MLSFLACALACSPPRSPPPWSLPWLMPRRTSTSPKGLPGRKKYNWYFCTKFSLGSNLLWHIFPSRLWQGCSRCHRVNPPETTKGRWSVMVLRVLWFWPTCLFSSVFCLFLPYIVRLIPLATFSVWIWRELSWWIQRWLWLWRWRRWWWWGHPHWQ